MSEQRTSVASVRNKKHCSLRGSEIVHLGQSMQLPLFSSLPRKKAFRNNSRYCLLQQFQRIHPMHDCVVKKLGRDCHYQTPEKRTV
jgi:hypothetical protein